MITWKSYIWIGEDIPEEAGWVRTNLIPYHNGIAGYMDFMIRIQWMVFTGVKGVFKGVLNTVGWMECVILIRK